MMDKTELEDMETRLAALERELFEPNGVLHELLEHGAWPIRNYSEICNQLMGLCYYSHRYLKEQRQKIERAETKEQN